MSFNNESLNVSCNIWHSTVAHKCNVDNKSDINLNFITSHSNSSLQIQTPRSKFKFLTPNSNFSLQIQIHHWWVVTISNKLQYFIYTPFIELIITLYVRNSYISYIVKKTWHPLAKRRQSVELYDNFCFHCGVKLPTEELQIKWCFLCYSECVSAPGSLTS